MSSETAYVKLTRSGNGDATFTAKAVFGADSDLRIGTVGNATDPDLYVQLPDQTFSLVFLLAGVIVEDSLSPQGDNPKWCFPQLDPARKYNSENTTTLSVGIPTAVWTKLMSRVKVAIEPRSLTWPFSITASGYTWLFCKAKKPVAFTVTLQPGKPERLPDLQDILLRTGPSAICDVGFYIQALFKSNMKAELEFSIAGVHVRGLSEVVSPKLIQHVSSVATDDVVAEDFVEQLQKLGLKLEDGSLVVHEDSNGSADAGLGSNDDAGSDSESVADSASDVSAATWAPMNKS